MMTFGELILMVVGIERCIDAKFTVFGGVGITLVFASVEKFAFYQRNI